jgi:hypothetical protein
VARPRKSAKVLEFTGAFDHNPQREREDLAGTGVFDTEPPKRLHKNYHAAWRHIVERLPAFTFTASDEMMVEHAARILGKMWESEQNTDLLLKLHGPLMNCLQALGLSPSSRTKMGDFGKGNGKKNKFEALGEE